MNLAEIKKSLEEISPYPWCFKKNTIPENYNLETYDPRPSSGYGYIGEIERINDINFIYKSPETISFLISEIERLQKQLEDKDELIKKIDELQQGIKNLQLNDVTSLCQFEIMSLENKILKEALSFYANPSNWVKRETELGGLSLMNHDDHGRTAREALGKGIGEL